MEQIYWKKDSYQRNLGNINKLNLGFTSGPWCQIWNVCIYFVVIYVHLKKISPQNLFAIVR